MQLSNEKLLEFYHLMVKIRAFEETMSCLFSKGLLGGTSHFCIGQEASAVGVVQGVRDTDWIVSNHRGHGHLLARYLDVDKVMAELLGKLTGYCGGRGGSQHMCAMDKCFLGTNGITGGGIPLATGAALALKVQKKDDIVVAFFGDGASNQGTFHESLNIAALWNLPILFICENNKYAMSTPVNRTVAGGGQVAPRAAGYKMRAGVFEGRDVEIVYQATQEAAERLRNGGGPELLELMTYRLCGHSKSEPRVYRTREEEAEMAKLDPLVTLPQRLLERGVTQEQIDVAAKRARDMVAEAAEKGLAAPVGDRAYALDGVFAEN